MTNHSGSVRATSRPNVRHDAALGRRRGIRRIISPKIANPIAGQHKLQGTKTPQTVIRRHNAPQPAPIWNSGVTRWPTNPAPARNITAPIAQVTRTVRTSVTCGKYGVTTPSARLLGWDLGDCHGGREDFLDGQ